MKNYDIVYGVKGVVEEIVRRPITQSMLDFAREFYQHRANVPFFNEEKWQQVIDKHRGVLPFEIDALPDGTAALPGDPLIRITGPNELVAHFEPKIHRLFYSTGVATNYHVIARHGLTNRFIETGLRGVPTELDHLIVAEAMYVGGSVFMTSNDAAVAVNPNLKDTGTIGHRYVQSFPTEEDAFVRAIERLDTVALLIDTFESYQGIERALRLKKKYRDTGKKIWIRLDSGDIDNQAIYAFSRMNDEKMNDPLLDRIIVMSLDFIDDMPRIDSMVREAGFNPEERLFYGAGHIVDVSGTTRSDHSSGVKLTRFGDLNTMKKSSSVGKNSIPGMPTLVRLSDGSRVRAQVGEFDDTVGTDLLVPSYREGQLLVPDDIESARARVGKSFEEIKKEAEKGEKTPFSTQTRKIMEEFDQRLISQN